MSQKIQALPHHSCGSKVHVLPTAGGRGSGELTSYGARCDKCGFISDHLGRGGSLDSAIRHHNRLQLEKAEDDSRM